MQHVPAERHLLGAMALSTLVTLTACGGQGEGITAQPAQASMAAPALAVPVSLKAVGPTLSPFVATTYDPAQADQVRVGSIVVGDTRYNDVLARFSSLVGIGNGVATRSYDSYDGGTGQLTVASVLVGGVTYTDVVVSIAEVLSVGSAAPLAAVIPNDPLFGEQWHLRNTGQAGVGEVPGKAGEDLNVTMAWNYATGTGVRIAVVDDGMDIHHEDLNVVAGKSWDYRSNSYGDPSSDVSSHGTACAGLAAAQGHNGIGVTGVAFNARLVGYNLLSATTGEYGADAVTKDLADNHIYTNSYGATDGTGVQIPSDQAWRDAIDTGTRSGRQGKGAIYTWAAGNGAPTDRSDHDGSANYQGVLAIGALNDQGQRSSYSEPGANLLVMAFGGEDCSAHTVTTTDVSAAGGYNNGSGPARPEDAYTDYPGQPNYTRCMNGTSAATPEAAGAIALMLEANPALGWRDVRAILAHTARKVDPADADWVTNAAGLAVNHNFGFGALDATAAVRAARTWQNMPAQRTADAASTTPLAVADAGAATTTALTLAGSGISKIEFVDLTVDSDHPSVGDLEITLTSPSGTRSTVNLPHECKQDPQEGEAVVSCGNTLAGGFRFGIVRLMDEAADGAWTLSVRDAVAGNAGTLSAWSIKVYGH
jgi:proprotein convertase subtilisin/kexin type 2